MIATGVIGLLAGILVGYVTTGKRKGVQKLYYIAICAAAGMLIGAGIPLLTTVIGEVLIKIGLEKTTETIFHAFISGVVFYVYSLLINYGAFYLANQRCPNKNEKKALHMASGGVALCSGLGVWVSGTGELVLTLIGILWDGIIAPIWAIPGKETENYKDMDEFLNNKKSFDEILNNVQ